MTLLSARAVRPNGSFVPVIVNLEALLMAEPGDRTYDDEGKRVEVVHLLLRAAPAPGGAAPMLRIVMAWSTLVDLLSRESQLIESLAADGGAA
jgi:hypothetical protein